MSNVSQQDKIRGRIMVAGILATAAASVFVPGVSYAEDTLMQTLVAKVSGDAGWTSLTTLVSTLGTGLVAIYIAVKGVGLVKSIVRGI